MPYYIENKYPFKIKRCKITEDAGKTNTIILEEGSKLVTNKKNVFLTKDDVSKEKLARENALTEKYMSLIIDIPSALKFAYTHDVKRNLCARKAFRIKMRKYGIK